MDTAKIKEIKEASKLENPGRTTASHSLDSKTGKDFRDLAYEILVVTSPVSGEVASVDLKELSEK
jgi:hypothetical protein